MRKKPSLNNATLCTDPKTKKRPDFISEEAWSHTNGPKGYVEIGSRTGEFAVGATFIINKYSYEYSSHGFSCKGTKEWLSVSKMSGGANNLDAFDKPGAEKSYDYDSLPANKILDLSINQQEAIEIVEQNYIGKTLRTIARSAEGCTPYGGRYYLFSIED